ncbi:MAG: hypothetical protein AAF541_06200 [Pseudomonadota bacterium]
MRRRAALLRRLRLHVWRICLREIPATIDAPQLPEELNFILLDESQMRELGRCHPMVSEAFVEQAIVQGDSCVVVFRGHEEGTWQEHLMGFSWRTQSSVEFIEALSVRLKQENTFFGFKTWVERQARGMGLFQKMREYQDLHSQSIGTRLGVAYINVNNHSSWASMQRDVRYKKVGYLVYAGWGKLAWSWVSPGAGQWIEVMDSGPIYERA